VANIDRRIELVYREQQKELHVTDDIDLNLTKALYEKV
jgi:hypothetical protein